MSETISESKWSKFVEKQKLGIQLDDKDLRKVLAKVEKTDEAKPEARLEAVEDLIKLIPKQVAALGKLKKQLGDKVFGLVKDELYEIEASAQALLKKTRAALEAQQDEDGEEDEEAAPSALVNPKVLFKQLGMCRKDPGRTMKFAFVDAKGKEQPSMLAIHPRMGARSLFVKLQAAAGVKTGAYGSVWVDGTELMLQLDKPLSGLAKKIRGPVRACGFKISKAVLWNADGTVFEQDATADETAEGSDTAPESPATNTAGTAPDESSKGAPPSPALTYEAKRAAIQPRVAKAAAAGSPDALKHQKLLEFAGGKAAGGDYLGAVAALRQVEMLLDNPTPGTAGTGNTDERAGFMERLAKFRDVLKEARAAGHPSALEASAKAAEVAAAAGRRDFEQASALLDEAEALLQSAAPQTSISIKTDLRAARRELVRARDALDEALGAAGGQVRRLQALMAVHPDPQLREIAGSPDAGINALTGNHRVRMIAALRDLEQADVEALPKALGRARSIARSFLTHVRDDARVKAFDDNPLGVPVQIGALLSPALQTVDEAIDAFAA